MKGHPIVRLALLLLLLVLLGPTLADVTCSGTCERWSLQTEGQACANNGCTFGDSCVCYAGPDENPLLIVNSPQPGTCVQNMCPYGVCSLYNPSATPACPTPQCDGQFVMANLLTGCCEYTGQACSPTPTATPPPSMTETATATVPVSPSRSSSKSATRSITKSMTMTPSIEPLCPSDCPTCGDSCSTRLDKTCNTGNSCPCACYTDGICVDNESPNQESFTCFSDEDCVSICPGCTQAQCNYNPNNYYEGCIAVTALAVQ